MKGSIDSAYETKHTLKNTMNERQKGEEEAEDLEWDHRERLCWYNSIKIFVEARDANLSYTSVECIKIDTDVGDSYDKSNNKRCHNRS